MHTQIDSEIQFRERINFAGFREDEMGSIGEREKKWNFEVLMLSMHQCAIGYEFINQCRIKQLIYMHQ